MTSGKKDESRIRIEAAEATEAARAIRDSVLRARGLIAEARQAMRGPASGPPPPEPPPPEADEDGPVIPAD